MKKQLLFRNTAHSKNPLGTVARFDEGIDDSSHSDADFASAQAFTLGQLLAGGTLGRRPGITIGHYFFSAELLLMIAYFVLFCFTLRRTC